MELGQQNALESFWNGEKTLMNLNYTFKDVELLKLALTQSGVDSKHNNERLEFLGDRVLGLSVALLLYKMYPTEPEGNLARRHARLVSTDTLSNVARKIGLAESIRHGHITGGKISHILANTMEAVLGAVMLDSDFKTAQQLISELWTDLATADIVAPKDAKTTLQEFVQKNDSGALPIYEYTAPTGTSHDPEFNVTVTAMGKSATGSGNSKKNASLDAAANLLKILAI